jgi:hypothetical protein
MSNLRYVPKIDITTSTNFREGYLADNEIHSWLHYEGAFAPPKPPPLTGNLRGGIRLLICECTSLFPLGFSMSKESYQAVELAFRLHPATLSSFDVQSGTYSRHFTYSAMDPSKLERISRA